MNLPVHPELMKKQDVFAGVYQEFHPTVLRLCHYMLGSREEAEDAANDIFVRLPRAIETYDSTQPFSRWLSRVASNYCVDLLRARRFYERHGGKTIILARFIPIIRTFAPFVAGIGRMSYPRFAAFNVTGGILWVLSFLMAGYWFADLPIVKERFHYVILAIIILSVLPAILEYLRARRHERLHPDPSPTKPALE